LAASVRELKRTRDRRLVREKLRWLYERAQAGETVNILPPMIEAAKASATLGEMLGTIRFASGHPYDPLGVVAPPEF
jgi:methylmalonyl-CoA mutase N-terminal domain/subunit